MDTLPDDLCRQLAGFLDAPEIMSAVKLNKGWNTLGKTERFWKDLLLRDSEPSILEGTNNSGNEAVRVAACKRIFLVHAHANRLSSVKWCAVQRNVQMRHPSSREGHIMCVMGNRIVCTGGFCDDERIHLLNLRAPESEPKRWHALSSRGMRPQFVYGATLTALDDRRAVRFGGFRAGGYAAECNDVCMLTIERNEDSSCRWERMVTQGPPPRPRAYQSATLIQNRYLLFIGGMGTNGSILNETVLDTVTWSWISEPVSNPMASSKPTGRHGHTTVLDCARNRCVLFGGGSGSDLLRSGTDNTEVWELKLGDDWEDNFTASFPWQWRRIHSDENDESDPNQDANLSPSETLCLGRCHIGAKVSRDTVIFTCGSGRPTTNGVLAYNLKSDTFVRPTITGPLPMPRFTAAAAFTDGWLVIHGGYSTQEGGAMGDTVLLDFAPALSRRFGSLPFATNAESQPAIRDDDIDRGRSDNAANRMMGELVAAPVGQRQALASQMLNRLLASGQLGGRSAVILSLVANGSAVFGDEADSDDHIDSDDPDADEEESGEDNADEDDEDDELSVGL